MRIFIIGFMGAGKTHWGKIWAEELGVPFLDLDEYIVDQQQQSIVSIFQQKGEAAFRKIEATALRSTFSMDNCVVACGGGTPCFENNIEWMNHHGQTIFISVQPETLYERLRQATTSRPLIQHMSNQQLQLYIEQSLEERMPFYSQAERMLEETLLTPQIIHSII